MHKGQLATLAAVLDHYNEAPDAMIGHNEAKPLDLRRRELRQIEAFLHALAAPVAGPTVTIGTE
jgi:cytochrome c peroxidase